MASQAAVSDVVHRLQPEQPNREHTHDKRAPIADNDDENDDKEDLTDDSGDDEESDGQVNPERVLLAYRHLSSRRIDLIGDYAGNELFFIEGDSMLLRCFSDDKLDFDQGFQLLHATYLVEHFLRQLVQRKCRFNIVFFRAHKSLCIPPSARHPARYLLARAAVIRHLQLHLTKTCPGVKINVYESWHTQDFRDAIHASAPYFVMAHDGAQAVDRQSKLIVDDSSPQGPPTNALSLRTMILALISYGLNVALINGLEWRDTKIMTTVLESQRRPPSLSMPPLEQDQPSSSETEKDIEKLGDLAANLTERQLIAVLALSKMLHTTDDEERITWSFAFLRHLAVLASAPLHARRLEVADHPEGLQTFLSDFANAAESIVNHPAWESLSKDSPVCDMHDLVDGRLFIHLAQSSLDLDTRSVQTYDRLLHAFKLLADKLDPTPALTTQDPQTSSAPHVNGRNRADQSSVLPFSNRVFDKHLASVQVNRTDIKERDPSIAAHTIFQEATHWHNTRKLSVKKGPPPPADKKQADRAAKRNQLFMAEMRTYAASLTNAVGKSLEPETVITGQPRQPVPAQPKPNTDEPNQNASTPKAESKPKKGSGGGKTAKKNAEKQSRQEKLDADRAKKDDTAKANILSAWKTTCRDFDADSDPRERYRKAKSYLIGMQQSARDIVGPECELYMLASLLQYWIDACRRGEQAQRRPITALIWSHARHIAVLNDVPNIVLECVDQAVQTLKLPSVGNLRGGGDPGRKLAFTFPLPSAVTNLHVGLEYREFQLLEAGPYLERTFDSREDPRVDFRPDGWQRRVLDSIDADHSVFVVAPTSAGKTFISFYAMRKVLEADDDSVLVYVAPTKALVNQLAAEIQARYSKTFKHGGKSVWAIHTRDYRINNPNGCQILVTVPHILQIMLLAGSNAKAWSSRVKRIIFDEIHSIGQAEDGVVWEQLLLMAPCPIIALSATVGNPDEFSSWLESTQEAIGNKLVTVHHPYRYSDLRKYLYVPPKQFSFGGLPDKKSFGVLGLEGLVGFNYIHPVAALVDKFRGIPEDLALEPRDCFLLWQAMTQVQTESYPVAAHLAPDKALPNTCQKTEILEWEKDLKALLKLWLEDDNSPYDSLIKSLDKSFSNDRTEATYKTSLSVTDNDLKSEIVDSSDLVKSTLPLLCRLQEQDALPAILFNYDRHQCEKTAQGLLDQLTSAETSQKKTGPKWEALLARWEEWKVLKEKGAAKASKLGAKKTKKSKDDDDEKTSKLDQQKDAAGSDDTKWNAFDPDAPMESYHFADHTKVQLSELEVMVRQLRWRDVPPWLIDALVRGIGVHHAGMNRKYRQIVEILFRKGFLRVVIATGTLALGINMPCKTVVFAGDSVFLTALNYRQCAGRAGRRGFDLLGNVVFQGVSKHKVSRLISSRLPDLNGHFPITTTLVLRLFTLLNDSGYSKYAVSAIDALLTQPRLYMGGPSFKAQTMHHLRFSIEYLRRQHLLGANGVPLNFAGLVSHLYFTENSSFAFHALLKEGYFHQLCAARQTNEKDTLETLMLVMAHLFNRVPCRQADTDYREKVVKPSSSIVFLPPMPERAATILRDHNSQTLETYRAYVRTFIDQHLPDEDDTLPLTKLQIGNVTDASTPSLSPLSPTRIRSPFVALSGAGDDFTSIHDLCSTVRDGVFLEEAVIPHVSLYPDEADVPLNAWLLDFYKHGDVHTLERANGIRRSDVWFMLNDFSLVLATLVTSLRNFILPGSGASDLDFLEVMGDLTVHEEAEDVQAGAMDLQSEVSGPSVADSGVVIPSASSSSSSSRPKPVVEKKREAVMESWEDFDDGGEDEGDLDASHDSGGENAKDASGANAAAAGWEGKHAGLRDVLVAFERLQAEFTVKFKAMWA